MDLPKIFRKNDDLFYSLNLFYIKNLIDLLEIMHICFACTYVKKLTFFSHFHAAILIGYILVLGQNRYVYKVILLKENLLSDDEQMKPAERLEIPTYWIVRKRSRSICTRKNVVFMRVCAVWMDGQNRLTD